MALVALAALSPEAAVAQTEKVLVRNTPAKPVPVRQVDDLPLEPVHMSLFRAFDGELCQGTVFVIPDGKQLVMEHVSAAVYVPEGQKVASNIGVFSSGSHMIVMTEQFSKVTSLARDPLTLLA